MHLRNYVRQPVAGTSLFMDFILLTLAYAPASHTARHGAYSCGIRRRALRSQAHRNYESATVPGYITHSTTVLSLTCIVFVPGVLFLLKQKLTRYPFFAWK